MLPSADVALSGAEGEARRLAEELDQRPAYVLEDEDDEDDDDNDEFGAGLNSLADHLFGDGADSTEGLRIELAMLGDERTESTHTPSPKASDLAASETHTERSEMPSEAPTFDEEAPTTGEAVGIRLLQQRRRAAGNTGSSSSTNMDDTDDLVARWMKQRW